MRQRSIYESFATLNKSVYNNKEENKYIYRLSLYLFRIEYFVFYNTMHKKMKYHIKDPRHIEQL